ncbi:hypothetical protein REPUB_Repub13aG0142000 [Reevesia pubescens]
MEDIEGQPRKFTWRIENFSSIKDKKLYSKIFNVGGKKWRLLIFPKGNNVDHFSIYLGVADSATLSRGWSTFAKFRLSLINQIDPERSIMKESQHEFNSKEDDWGFTSFLPLSELYDPKRGYLMNNACLVEALISTDWTIDLVSHEIATPSPAPAPPVLSSPGQDNTKSTDQPLPTAQASFQTETSEPGDPAEEDMDTFFTSLESELASSNYTVSSQEEAKEALAKLEEALNMAPANFYDPAKFSPLTQAFKILSSFLCSSTLTIEQKNELLAIEENFKELPDRVAKAAQDRNLLTEKESDKRTLTRNLERSLIKFKEAQEEVKQVEQKIAALHVQVDEAQKNRENILAERKQIFRTSREMKMELETLGKE